MEVFRSLALLMVLVMVLVPSIISAGWNMNNYLEHKEMEDKIPWPLVYSLGKRSLSGTQDWGKRSAPARPLRLGKRGFKIENLNPAYGGKYNILKPHSLFGFK